MTRAPKLAAMVGRGVATAIDDDDFVRAAAESVANVFHHPRDGFFFVHRDHSD